MKLLRYLFSSNDTHKAQDKATIAQCPICKSIAFQAYNGRPTAQCVNCKSLERSRLLWTVLQHYGALKDGPQRVLHVAPEHCFIRELHTRYKDGYHPVDIKPETYKNRVCQVEKLDLCEDLSAIEDASFDVIIHNHVLEHIPCGVAETLNELNRILAPAGRHFFSVPFRRGTTTENLSPDLPAEDRIRQFGQIDHLRMFGTDDFLDFLKENFGDDFTRVDPLEIMNEAEISNANIQVESIGRLDGNSIFYYQKSGS